MYDTLLDTPRKMSTTTTTETQSITADNILRLFPQINTALATQSATQDHDLEGYDEEQIRLMDEVCIVLDDNDKPIGSASKKVCASLSACSHAINEQPLTFLIVQAT